MRDKNFECRKHPEKKSHKARISKVIPGSKVSITVSLRYYFLLIQLMPKGLFIFLLVWKREEVKLC